MLKSLDLYLIQVSNNRLTLFSPSDVLEAFESASDNRIQRFISWFMRRKNRIAAWFGRVLHAGYGYYVKIEDRIDPVERVLKAMSNTREFVIHYGSLPDNLQVQQEFRAILKRQRKKHGFWFGVNLAMSSVIAVFTPFLMPIPGPNVFFYYPFLRLLSHYRAFRGTTAGLHFDRIHFKCLPELTGLEENLRTPRFDRSTVRTMAEGLNIRGLEQFLERMV